MLTIKNKFKASKNQQQFFYLLSFLLPALTIFIYFACNHFNVLIVDLGQQYVDFLAFLRRNLVTDPLQLIYSFQNGLGGSMIATSAYYLLSPLNLILFLFPQNQLPLAILTVIALKFGFCGLTSFYYWQKIKHNNKYYAWAASCAYALSGYAVANYFNIMWLDTLILLPLLLTSIDQIFKNEKDHLVLITFLIWFTNFYTGAMALLFGFLSFLSKICFVAKNQRKRVIFTYLKKSILGSFLCSFILLPVFGELITERTNEVANWSFSWQFRPDLEIAKLALGSYSFHEMEAGMPNIFMTTPFVLLTISYFMQENIDRKRRIINGILLLFLILSLDFTPLVLVWHLGQFPTWYPGRFSFVLIFFCLNLALQSLQIKQELPLWSKIIIGLFAIAFVSYCYFMQNNFTFFNEDNLVLITLFLVLALLFLYFIMGRHHLAKQFLFAIVDLEAIANLILSLNNLSFQNNRDYQNFAANGQQATTYLKKRDASLYRVEKTFSRSDDDPFTANYNGISSFNSITNQHVFNFLSNLGYLHNSNSFNNLGSTAISDSLLGVKYYLQPNYERQVTQTKKMQFANDNGRQDVNFYHLLKKEPQLVIRQNQAALKPIFLSQNTSKNFTFIPDQPALNQERLLNFILNQNTQIMHELPLPKAKLQNAKFLPNTHTCLTKDEQNNSYLTYQLHLKTNDSYYLQLPAGLEENQVSLTINGKTVNLEVCDDQTHLLNVANEQKGITLKLKFQLLQKQVAFDGLSLYRINNPKLQQNLLAFKQVQLQIRRVNPLYLASNNFRSKKQVLLTTIPYSHNWLIFDHRQRIKPSKFAATFLQVKLTDGEHKLRFIYVPWLFLIGLLLSLLTLIMIKCIR